MREGLTVAEAQELILEATPMLGAETIAASITRPEVVKAIHE